MKATNNYIIKIKVKDYKDLFYDFDFTSIDNRVLRDDIDTFIMNKAIDMHKARKYNAALEVYLPKSSFCSHSENLAIESINNYYESKIEMDIITINTAKKRLLYYLLLSFSISILWYVLDNYFGIIFLGKLLDTSATVVLWQATTILFIESKNYSVTRKVNRIFNDMEIKFKYLD